MTLHERLKELIGHEIFIDTLMPGDKDIPDGILKEVEPDYIVIDTTNAEKTGQVDTAADWFVRMDMIVSVGHPYDCSKCAVEAAMEKS
jgi:hypothetical protein